ncbi:unnamed protein product [Polarella glacialis]|uniref:Phosphoinositide phospholipase C n=1 Tax=Polarella glacialis TaxID=89957 RepID=A0A813HN68_POLGL|nr:unnamed protein product [Polarella glacialis]
MQEIQDRKIGNRFSLRLKLSVQSMAQRLLCGKGFFGDQNLDRVNVLEKAIFGPYLSRDGLHVDAVSWRREVQGDRGSLAVAQECRSAPGMTFLPAERMSAVTLLRTDVMAESNLPHRDKQASCGLDRSLAAYWINSSHNSYLQGNQLTSSSSTAALRNLLRQGCRVVELDVYDGQKYGIRGPCVLHGGTMTDVVPFQDCLRAIRDAAFETSDAPVIITLENHTKEQGQRQCAALLRSELGDALFVPSVPGLPSKWPSPAELRRRFLLRDKIYEICGEAEENESGLEEGMEQVASPTKTKTRWSRIGALEKLLSRGGGFSPTAGAPHSPLSPQPTSSRMQTLPRSCAVEAQELRKRPSKAKELHDLISIGNMKLLGIEDAGKWMACTSSSISELRLAKMVAKDGLDVLRAYTAVHIVRVFPAGYRLDSSNYDPQDAWEAGCQMVALNYQSSVLFHPHSAWLNAGKFRGNGGCGYVQKPPHLLQHLSDGETGSGELHPMKLAITVLAGDGWEAFRDFDLVGAPDSYVCVEVAGAAADRRVARTSVFTSRARTGSQAQPVWKHRSEFLITDPSLAVLLLVAWDQDVDFDDLLGQYAFPVSELRPGWRRVPLLDSNGGLQDGRPSLLCHFEVLE